MTFARFANGTKDLVYVKRARQIWFLISWWPL